MSDFKSFLKADPTNWLLEEENPSVRYYALKDLLDRPEDDQEVQTAKQEIMRRGIVPKILQRQQEDAYRKNFPSFYTFKYKGLVWQLITLAELGAAIHPQIKEQCEYLLSNSQEPGDGGFSMHEAVKTGGGRISEVIPCLTGNMVWCMIRFGYLDDPRVQKGISYITRFLRLNDGIEEDPQVPPYNKYDTCWGSHTCHMGVVKPLRALAEIPEGKRSGEVSDTIQKAAEFMLMHHIFKRSRSLHQVSKPGWKKFGFPMMYQTDILEILDILTGLGIRDSRMDEAIDIVLSKQDEAGRWKMENTYNLLVPVEEKDAQSKWITLRAMRVLKRYNM